MLLAIFGAQYFTTIGEIVLTGFFYLFKVRVKGLGLMIYLIFHVVFILWIQDYWQYLMWDTALVSWDLSNNCFMFYSWTVEQLLWGRIFSYSFIKHILIWLYDSWIHDSGWSVAAIKTIVLQIIKMWIKVFTNVFCTL